MKSLVLATLCLSLALVPALPCVAQDMPPPRPMAMDDKVIFDLTSESWVATKTAHVSVNAAAAVSATNSGTMRADMTKAVNDLAKSDWRLTSFNRTQDQTGLERWNAVFETRLPESELNGLSDTAKKLSKAGMQITMNGIDFSPTLAEMESARADVRAQIYKMANDQLAALNTSLPGRSYRISTINFTGEGEAQPMPQVVRGQMASMMMKAQQQSNGVSQDADSGSMERSEKVTLSARVTLAATASAPLPVEVKR